MFAEESLWALKGPLRASKEPLKGPLRALKGPLRALKGPYGPGRALSDTRTFQKKRAFLKKGRELSIF